MDNKIIIKGEIKKYGNSFYLRIPKPLINANVLQLKKEYDFIVD